MLEVDVVQADFAALGEIAVGDIAADLARSAAVVRDIDVSAAFVCDGAVDAADHAGGIHDGAGTLVQIAGSGIAPGVEEVALTLAEAVPGQDGTILLVVRDEHLKRGIGDLQISQRHAQDAEAPRVFAVQLMGAARNDGPVDLLAASQYANAAKIAEIPAVHEIFGCIGKVARIVRRQLRNGDEERAAALDIAAQNVILLLRAGIPARKEQRLIIGKQKFGRNIVIGKGYDVDLSVGCAGEMDVDIGLQNRHLGEEDITREGPAPLGRSLEPGGIFQSNVVEPAYGIAVIVSGRGQIEIALRQSNGRLRLSLGRAVFTNEAPEVRDDLPVVTADGGAVVRHAEVRTGLLDKGTHPLGLLREDALCIAPADDAELVLRRLRHLQLRGIRRERMLDVPVAGFVDDHLAAGHVFKVKCGAKRVIAMRRTVGLPVIVLMRQMGAPHRQIVLPVQSAGERACQVEAREGEILDDGHIRAADHLVIDVEVAGGRHDELPAVGVALIRVLLHGGQQVIRQRTQRELSFAGQKLCLRSVESAGEALAEVVSEIVIAALLNDAPDPFPLRVGIDHRGIESALLRLKQHAQKARAAAIPVALEQLLVLRLGYGEILKLLPIRCRNVDARSRHIVNPVADKLRRHAAGNAPELYQIALIVGKHPIQMLLDVEMLALPAEVPGHGAQKRIRIRGIDSGAYENSFRRQLDFIHVRLLFFPFWTPAKVAGGGDDFCTM